MFKQQQRHQHHSLILAALLILVGSFLPLLMSCTQEEKKAPAPRARRAGTGTAQTTAAKPAIEPTSVIAVIETAKGNIEFEFLAETPETAKNFIKKAKIENYKDEKFDRVEPLFIQASSKFRGDTIPIENGSREMSRGVVAMVKEEGASVSDASGFFICRDTTLVDSDYTVFGTVISGMNVVDNIVIDDAIMNITIRDKAE